MCNEALLNNLNILVDCKAFPQTSVWCSPANGRKMALHRLTTTSGKNLLFIWPPVRGCRSTQRPCGARPSPWNSNPATPLTVSGPRSRQWRCAHHKWKYILCSSTLSARDELVLGNRQSWGYSKLFSILNFLDVFDIFFCFSFWILYHFHNKISIVIHRLLSVWDSALLLRQTATGRPYSVWLQYPEWVDPSFDLSSPWWHAGICQDADRWDHHTECWVSRHHRHRQSKDQWKERWAIKCNLIRFPSHWYTPMKSVSHS